MQVRSCASGVCRRPRWFFCLLLAAITYVLYLVGGLMVWQRRHVHPWHKVHGCSNEESESYLAKLCRDYLNGMVGGSLCDPLCVRREVEFVRCLGHGVKLHVLLAQWAANTVVLKTDEPLNNRSVAVHLDWYTDHHRLIPKQEFVHKANRTLFQRVAGGRHVPSTLAAIERVFSECDVLGDGQLSYTEAVVCWQLLETDEFVLLSVLSGVSAIPDVYGACGNMYAMQYASSQPFLDGHSPVADRRSWHFRARLAIALIEMAYSIETTPYGTLYLCDVKGANFGLVRTHSGLVAKAIDLDLSWFEAALAHRRRLKRCKKDSDCDFVNCHIACNTDTHICSGPMLSNNLQVLCVTMLFPHGTWDNALLRDPPPSVEGELTSVLEQLYTLPEPHVATHTMTKLLSLLHTSLVPSDI